MGSFLGLSRLFRLRSAWTEEPYSAFSRVYDHAMYHVDYEEWAEYIVRLFDNFGKGVRSVLEGGCGTGSMLRALSARGYRIAGFDRSLAMVQSAAGKVDCPLWQGDLRNAESLRRWDAFLCLYDTIQYFDMVSLPGLFLHWAELPNDGGLFVFDVITERHARMDWGNYTEQDSWEGVEYIRHTRFERRRRILQTDFAFYHPRENRTYRERHVQFIHPLKEIERAAASGGFTVLGMFDEFTLNPGTEASDRVHFVLRKEDR